MGGLAAVGILRDTAVYFVGWPSAQVAGAGQEAYAPDRSTLGGGVRIPREVFLD